MWRAAILALVLLACPISGWAAGVTHGYDATHYRGATGNQPLPMIGPAPNFTLTSQDGAPVTLDSFRGKVVAVTFIFTSCKDTCPLLTAKMAQVQNALGTDFGRRISFISITVDPARDTPDVLKQYAQSFAANLAGWYFLTGTPAAIEDVTHRYGVFVSHELGGDVDHTFLTSLIDPRGTLRVQYLGARFDPEEFRRDLISLLDKTQ
jgi:protein SCO1/2